MTLNPYIIYTITYCGAVGLQRQMAIKGYLRKKIYYNMLLLLHTYISNVETHDNYAEDEMSCI